MPGSGMTQIPDVPAGTGLYPITDIDGHQPRGLTDFIGAVTISVAVAGTSRRLGGVGDLTDRGVQFHQQHTADVTDTDGECGPSPRTAAEPFGPNRWRPG